MFVGGRRSHPARGARCAGWFASGDYMSHRVSSLSDAAVGPEQLSTLLGSVRELIAILSPDGMIQFTTQATARVLGNRVEDLAGTPFASLVHRNDAASARQCLREIAASAGGTASFRCRLQSKDGSWRWFDASATNHTNNPFIEGIILSCRDVTDLQRMEAERQVISEVVHALNETANLDELLDGIHKALKKVLYAENCFVALHNPDTDTFSFPFFADQVDVAPPPQKVGRSCTAFVFRTGSAMLIPQSEFDRLAAQGKVELVGTPSPAWLGVPLKTPKATIGVLVVQHYENENAYDTRDMEFLSSVGGHIALAIERRRAEDALRKNEEMFRLLFSNNPLPTWVLDRETLRFLEVNDAAVQQYGYSRDEFRNMSLLDVDQGEEKEKRIERFRQWAGGGRYHGNWKHRKKDGKILEVESVSHELNYAGQRVRLVVAQDISARHLLEQQFRQAQKMEAVGRLAGGVAHDFNNLLMVIKGHTELLRNAISPTDQFSKKIEQIERAADRATSLTRQLLAFSRMQVLQPRVMNLNEVVEDMGRLLPRLIGEDIDLEIRTAKNRDAMPDGGRLLIETSNEDLDSAYNAVHPVVRQGSYTLLAVSDNGMGMDAETQAHIFEPFFTTKPQGKGTGLGLATVYGVVKQSGGFVWVYSELGKGTSFKIYLPRVDQPVVKSGLTQFVSDVPRGTETILLAEDEQDVREVAREFLESGGYTVIAARDGAEALKLVDAHEGAIGLLITDMVMPGMNGQELAGRLQQKRAGLQTLYMSGYSERAAAESAQGDSSIRLLTKPFSRSALLRTVHEILNPA